MVTAFNTKQFKKELTHWIKHTELHSLPEQDIQSRLLHLQQLAKQTESIVFNSVIHTELTKIENILTYLIDIKLYQQLHQWVLAQISAISTEINSKLIATHTEYSEIHRLIINRNKEFCLS